MTAVGDAATHNEKEVMTRYPVDKGLTAGTETQEGNQINLIPEKGSNVPLRKQVGL